MKNLEIYLILMLSFIMIGCKDLDKKITGVVKQEQSSLDVFMKVGRITKDSSIRTLIDNAINKDRDNILQVSILVKDHDYFLEPLDSSKIVSAIFLDSCNKYLKIKR